MSERRARLVPITLMGYRCERCGHQWVPRANAAAPPRVCAKCKSPYYDLPRRKPKGTLDG